MTAPQPLVDEGTREPPGWMVIETIEGESVDGLKLLVTRYPLSEDLSVADIASMHLEEQEAGPIATTHSPHLFRGVGGLLARPDQPEGNGWCWIFAFGRTRTHATIARIACDDKEGQTTQENRMLTILNSIEIPDGKSTFERGDPSNFREAFLGGLPSVLELPERDQPTVLNLGDDEAPEAAKDTDADLFYMSKDELGSLARAFGAGTFPGVTDESSVAATRHDLDAVARRAMIARGVLSFSGVSEIRVSQPLAQLVVTALQAALLVDVSSASAEWQSHTIIFATTDDCFRLDELAGGVFACRAIALGAIVEEVLSEADPDADGDSTPRANRIEFARATEGGSVELNEMSWVTADGIYERVGDQSGEFEGSTREEMRSLIVEALTG